MPSIPMLDAAALEAVKQWRYDPATIPGSTSAEKADGYERFLKQTAYPDYGGMRGNKGWILLRRPAADAVYDVVDLQARWELQN